MCWGVGGGASSGMSALNFHFNFCRLLVMMSLLVWGAREALYWLPRSRGFLFKFLEKQ